MPATLSIIVVTRDDLTIELMHGLDTADAVRDAAIIADYAHYPQLNAPAFAALNLTGRHAELGGPDEAIARFERIEPHDIVQVDVLANDSSSQTGAVIHPMWTWVRPGDQD